MDYKDSKIGFSATLDPSAKKPEQKATIGFTAAISKGGIGDPTHEPSMGFTAKLRERKPDVNPQMDLDF